MVAYKDEERRDMVCLLPLQRLDRKKQKKAKAWLSEKKGGIGVWTEVSVAAGNKSGYEAWGLLQVVWGGLKAKDEA